MANENHEAAASSTEILGIARLPKEILDEIALHVPLTSCTSLAQTSRIFYKSANSRLYRFVYFEQDQYDSCEKYGMHLQESWLYSEEHSTEICYINDFGKTITESPLLRSYIRGASFKWNSETETNAEQAITKALDILAPSLTKLHLKPAKCDMELPLRLPVTSLDLWYPRFNKDYDRHKFLQSELYAIFCIPTLRHLSLMYANFWQCFKELPSQGRARTSNVTTLSLPSTVPVGPDFAEILTWPKALKSLHFEIEISGRKFPRYEGNPRPITSPAVFIKAVESVQDSLEELLFNNGEDGGGRIPTTFGTALRNFPKLKRLAVVRECLVVTKAEIEIFGLHNQQILELYQVLPPALEELVMDVEFDFDWEWEDSRAVHMNYWPELRDWLSGVAAHKKDCYPSLRSVIIWQPSTHQPVPVGEHVLRKSGVFGVFLFPPAGNISYYRPFQNISWPVRKVGKCMRNVFSLHRYNEAHWTANIYHKFLLDNDGPEPGGVRRMIQHKFCWYGESVTVCLPPISDLDRHESGPQQYHHVCDLKRNKSDFRPKRTLKWVCDPNRNNFITEEKQSADLQSEAQQYLAFVCACILQERLLLRHLTDLAQQDSKILWDESLCVYGMTNYGGASTIWKMYVRNESSSLGASKVKSKKTSNGKKFVRFDFRKLCSLNLTIEKDCNKLKDWVNYIHYWGLKVHMPAVMAEGSKALQSNYYLSGSRKESLGRKAFYYTATGIAFETLDHDFLHSNEPQQQSTPQSRQCLILKQRPQQSQRSLLPKLYINPTPLPTITPSKISKTPAAVEKPAVLSKTRSGRVTKPAAKTHTERLRYSRKSPLVLKQRVSLVYKSLESVHRGEALTTIQDLPLGLYLFYNRMFNQLSGMRDYLATKNGQSILNSYEHYRHSEMAMQHLESAKSTTLIQNALTEHGKLGTFLYTKLLEWLECLGLLDKLPRTIEALGTLADVVELKKNPFLSMLVQDATRFLLRYYLTVATWPLQIYSSAVVFSPQTSVARRDNLDKLPTWLRKVPKIEESWASLIQTLAGHLGYVQAVAFSLDGKQIASGSTGQTIKAIGCYNRRPSEDTHAQNHEFDLLRCLSVCNQWINYGVVPVFFLPPDFKPQCYDIRGDQVTIEFRNSRVLSFDINRTSLDLILKTST
ncbi:hypothetical protein G7Y89_g10498 [Cudoniella acicularis]|uniref:F-box domain-containing protein n=1 Tax=Cudoniella acicularis TaxID=354080 RepID=A0A8H4RGB6_9HELO|nr:hypothetical protein G7Y89_g10498 [Cudoniella acicularis]